MIGNKYPYTNLYTLNLDWLFDKIKEIESAGGEVSEELEKIISGEIAVGNATHAVSADSADNATNASNAVSGSQLATAVSQAASASAYTSAVEAGMTAVPNATHAVSADNATNATNASNAVSGSQLATAVSQAASASAGVGAFADGTSIVKKAELSANGSNLDVVANKADSALSDINGIMYGNITVAKSTRATMDMDGNVFPNTYVKKTDIATGSAAGVVMANSLNGIDVDSAGQIQVHAPSNTNIDNRNTDENFYKRTAVTLKALDYAVKKSITTNANTLSSAEKTAFYNWVGNPTSIDVSSTAQDKTLNIAHDTAMIVMEGLVGSDTWKVEIDVTGVKFYENDTVIASASWYEIITQ